MNTVHGRIYSAWRRIPNGITVRISIPVNTRAAVSVPKLGFKDVTVRRTAPKRRPGCKRLPQAGRRTDRNAGKVASIVSLKETCCQTRPDVSSWSALRKPFGRLNFAMRRHPILFLSNGQLFSSQRTSSDILKSVHFRC